jgi:type I restriction enzyme S subunit
MNSIKFVRLSDISELITKGTTPTTLGFEFQDIGINFLKIECFDDYGNFISEKVTHISEECNEKLKRSKLQTGDILFSIAGAIGRVAIVTEEMLPANINQALAIIRINSDRIYLPYIKLILTSPIVIRQFEKKKQGVAQLNLSLKDINELEIPLLNKEKQIEIAKIFEKITMLINSHRTQLEKLDELVKSRFMEMFGDPEQNPFDFPIVNLGTVLTVEPQNGLYKPQSDYVKDGTGVPILRIDGFYNGKVTDFCKLKRLQCTDLEKERYLLNENDIVINRVNSIEYLGKCALIRGLLEETVFESNMMRFHIDESKFNATYITYLLCTKFIYNQILNRAKKAVNQASINQKDVRSFQIYTPTLELQNQFAAFVEQVDKSKYCRNMHLKKWKC